MTPAYRPHTAAPPPPHPYQPVDLAEAKRMSHARTTLLLDAQWFGAQALHLTFREDFGIKTFDTNGTLLRYNPNYSRTLTLAEVIFVIAHEVLHCGLLHPFRMGDRDPEEYNEAADFVVNARLLAHRGTYTFTPPAGILYDAQYADMNVEQVYAKRHGKRRQGPDGTPGPSKQPPPPGKQNGPQGPGPGGPADPNAPPPPPGKKPAGPGTPDPNAAPDPSPAGPGGQPPQNRPQQPQNGAGQAPNPCGQVSAPDPGTTEPDAPQPMSECDWIIATEQANAISAKAGTAPGNIIEAIRAAAAARIHWKDALNRYTEATIPTDISFSTPNRRHIANDLYLPGARKENMPRIGFGIDCSGSMTTRHLQLIAPEMTSLLHTCNPEALDLYLFDTHVREHIEYRPDSTGEIILTAKGRGGTAFQPVFDYIRDHPELTPACLIMFTDLEGPRPQEPPYPVLWITPESETATAWFGETVRISEY